MSQTKLRASKQIFFDANVDLNNTVLTNSGSPVSDHDLTNKMYVDGLISGLGSNIDHAGVQDLTACKAVTDYADKMIMLVEDLGLYRFDAQSTTSSDDNLVIRPGNISNDTLPGRWLKISSPLNNHNNLSGIQGGASNDYQHLTTAEKSAIANKFDSSHFVNREVPSGTRNGSNTVFGLTNIPIAGTEMVFVNGWLMNAGTGNDYTISGSNITMSVAPISSDTILVSYWK